MIKRGILLLVFEVLFVSTAFGGSSYYFGVIACIGVCFIIFSAYRRLPPLLILATSLFVVLNHALWIIRKIYFAFTLIVHTCPPTGEGQTNASSNGENSS